MPTIEPDAPSQKCSACGTVVDVTNEEPLARIACPSCGEKFRVERAFDNFVLLETLGVGGMGSVYKARDTRLDRLVALKILRRELSAEPAEAARLEHEARAAAAVNHPHVIQVFSSGTDHGQFYLVMELVDRGSLDDLMEEQGHLSEEQVLETGIQAAQGLQAAHEKGLIHRDIKPANILFANEHTAKIGDFGLALVAEQNAEAQNEIWGTPYYVAPERLNNEPEDFRSDIYSLGATLFHAISGRPPIEGESNSASALRELKNWPLNLGEIAPGLGRETVRVINRMVAPDPSRRFPSYSDLIEELQKARDAVHGGEPTPGRSFKVVGAIALIVALGAGAFYFYKGNATQPGVAGTPNTATPSPAKVEAKAEEQKRVAQEQARQLAERQKVEEVAREQQRLKVLEKERPLWNAALAAYKKQIPTYDFASALAELNKVQLTDAELKANQQVMGKKAQWLIEWKRTLISDLNARIYKGAVKDAGGFEYNLVAATETEVTLKNPDVEVKWQWAKFPSPKLLEISAALIRPGAPDAADRQWLSAVFASETGQAEVARQLGEAAARAKPQYQQELGLLGPQAQTTR